MSSFVTDSASHMRREPRALWLLLIAISAGYALFAALASIAVGAWLGSQADVLPEVALGDETQTDDEAWDELALLAFADELDAELAP